MSESIIVDCVVGLGCNFRCKYCYQQESAIAYTNVAMSAETADKVINYLGMLRTRHPDAQIGLAFFGGEPMLYFDRVKQIMAGALHDVDSFTISTNGSQTEEYKSTFLNLKQVVGACGADFTVSVSYDYALQNEMRQEGSCDAVRDAIRWLYHNGMLHNTNTVLNKGTLPRMDEVFFDFIALREECPGLNCRYNLDLLGDLSDFDEAATITALEKIRDYLKEHPEHWGSFRHNVMKRPGRGLSHVYGCFNPDESVTLGCSNIFQKEEVRKVLTLGSLNDDISGLIDRQDALRDEFNATLPEQCRSCQATCRVNFWHSLVSGDGKLNGMPTERSCEIRRLICSCLGEFQI